MFEISKRELFSSLNSAWGGDIREILARFNVDGQFSARGGQGKEAGWGADLGLQPQDFSPSPRESTVP